VDLPQKCNNNLFKLKTYQETHMPAAERAMDK
jgi:hypothetical protein